MSPKNFCDLQHQTEQSLRQFLHFIDLLNCKRCWRRRYKTLEATQQWGRPWHHHGALLHLFSKAKNITEPDLQLWVKDWEHGFLHGFITAYWAFLSEDKDLLLNDANIGFFKGGEKAENYLSREMRPEKLVVGCLFHDYLKCIGKEDCHDMNLQDYFDYLDSRIYEHANPTDDSYSLVKGDRIELLRFSNYSDWVDVSKLDLKKFEFAQHFYKHVRPIIHRIVQFREDIWLSHVVESKEGNKSHYPSAHWIASEPGLSDFFDHNSDYFSIHCGKLPFKDCLDHTEELGGVIGLISKKMLGERKIVAAPLSTWGRDHPFVKMNQPIPVEDWIFLYRDIEQIQWLDVDKIHPISISLFNQLVTTIDELLIRIFALMV